MLAWGATAHGATTHLRQLDSGRRLLKLGGVRRAGRAALALLVLVDHGGGHGARHRVKVR